VVARTRRTVFVIDADDDSRITHETILRAEGFEIMSAPDGERALSLLREESPDLVLLGEKIGAMSVVKLIRVLRSDVAKKPPVAVYARRLSERARSEIVEAGANVVISTPVTAHELVREVVGLIGRA
jgi:DNA-binding response OmpR family regulator